MDSLHVFIALFYELGFRCSIYSNRSLIRHDSRSIYALLDQRFCPSARLPCFPFLPLMCTSKCCFLLLHSLLQCTAVCLCFGAPQSIIKFIHFLFPLCTEKLTEQVYKIIIIFQSLLSVSTLYLILS